MTVSVQPLFTEPLYTSVNGQINATTSVADRGLAFGDGVFETLLLSDGKLPYLPYHLDRLQMGLARLRISASCQHIEAQLNQFLVQASKQQWLNGIVKVIVTRGQGRGYVPRQSIAPTVIISLFSPLEAKDDLQRDGVAITICQHRLSYQPALLGIKHLNRLDNVLAALEVSEKNCIEGIILDDRGNVAEGVSRNLFIVKAGELLTPDLQRGGIKGVSQRLIVEQLAPQLNLVVSTESLTPHQVRSAEEVFLCNSITGIWPINRIDDQKIPLGPITRTLQTAEKKWLSNQVGE